MNHTENLKFIEGQFEHGDAKEILMTIFNTKIQYNKLKNFSSQIRFEKEDEIALNRIKELKNEMSKFQKLIAEAKDKNLILQINADIKISLLK
jgi:hypothetical protein